jgi:PhnB protein
MSKSNITSIAPWLPVKGSDDAVRFYQNAFNASVEYKIEVPDGIIARLSIDGDEFWIAEEQETTKNAIRMILTVPDPDDVFAKAIAAGAKEVFAVNEQHGWRVGRITDPFGHDWEIGKELKYRSI